MVKVLFDHNMPPVLARALHLIISVNGHEAWALRDKYPVNISDIDLYEELGKDRDWIVISKDIAQAKRKPERAALLRYGVVAFYFAPSVEKLPHHQQAAMILWHWDAMISQRKTNANGLFLLPVNKTSLFQTI